MNMNLNKANRLLLKIQAFLDQENGHALSRLEKDLMKSYILQLYDVVSDEQITSAEDTHSRLDTPSPSPKMADRTPPVQRKEPPGTDPVRFVIPDPPKPEPIEVHAQTEIPEPAIVSRPLEPIPAPAVPVQESTPVQITIKEQVRETVHTITADDSGEALVKIFEVLTRDEVAGSFSTVPLGSIESGMGLNERIFTLNELFGGDKSLFDLTCAELNALHSFDEAREKLLSGPARQFHWSDPKRLKMAEEFIRIVARRYPKHQNG